MIQLRHRQPSLWHSGLAKDIEDLWEPWMKEVDQLLEDAALVESVYEAQLKRRHGLNRCRYRGFEGMRRWVGLGVIADNIIQIGRCLALQRA